MEGVLDGCKFELQLILEHAFHKANGVINVGELEREGSRVAVVVVIIVVIVIVVIIIIIIIVVVVVVVVIVRFHNSSRFSKPRVGELL